MWATCKNDLVKQAGVFFICTIYVNKPILQNTTVYFLSLSYPDDLHWKITAVREIGILVPLPSSFLAHFSDGSQGCNFYKQCENAAPYFPFLKYHSRLTDKKKALRV